MDLLTQELAQKAINSLGIDNYCLYGIPTDEKEFYEMFKPVVNSNPTGVVYADNEQYPFTFEEFIEAFNIQKQEYENNQYQRDRASEYPSIQDQLDTLYHQGYDGWKASIDEVKNKYPKTGEG
jgi:hypothetical protein